MSATDDIVSHEDIRASSSSAYSSTGLLPSLWSLLSRRARSSGRSGSVSPAKKRIRSANKIEDIPNDCIEPVRKRGRPKKISNYSSNVEAAPKNKRGRPKKPKLEEPTENGFVTAFSSPIKTHHVFSSPAKSPLKPILTQSPFKITLNKDFVPTPIPADGDYQAPQEKRLTYFFDGFEGYIDQKKPIRSHKKSTNSMALAPQITREQFSLLSNVLKSFLHKSSRQNLYCIQSQMFSQYWFEVTQGFSLLFYGIGSKRSFLEQFVLEYLSPRLALGPYSMNQPDEEKYSEDSDDIDGVPCVVINGYNPTCSYRDVFHSISQIMLPEELSKSETKYWSNHVELQTNKMIEVYRDTPSNIKLIILVHNLDGPILRKDPFQNMLSSLARVRQIALIASTDHIYAPLLWDHVRTQNFNFIFHDITNYENYSVESSFNDIMKLGRSDTSTGAEGARYVLESLTSNSKRMYRLLIETQLSNMDAQGKVTATKRGSHLFGIEFKQFYHMCAAEFIASNELSLRSMLGEFIEHKMAAISKDRTGAETMYVPYSYSEMQALLNDALDM